VERASEHGQAYAVAAARCGRRSGTGSSIDRL
jgi:hypothetical protein